MTFFPHFGVDCPECAAHVGALLADGTPPLLLRAFARGKMGGVLATKEWWGPILIDASEKLPDAMNLVSAWIPLPKGMIDSDPDGHHRAGWSSSQSHPKNH